MVEKVTHFLLCVFDNEIPTTESLFYLTRTFFIKREAVSLSEILQKVRKYKVFDLRFYVV